MKTMNDYMEMPYRMEIIEDKEEGGFILICQGALPAVKLLKLR